MNIFKKRRYISTTPIKSESIKKEVSEPKIPDGMWVKCPSCNKTIYTKDMDNHKICPACKWGFRLTTNERLDVTVDENSFSELFADLTAKNPMDYPKYEEKIAALNESTGLKDAVTIGIAEVGGQKCVMGIMDSRFIMGSMGSVVGEKITRAFEYATENKMHIIIFTASGGARMQEGIFSLMQMAKISAACKRHSDAGLLYVTVLTDPTTGGVTASFAMLGDIIIAEPKILVGFAGRRVIEQTIKQSLPDDFQKAEFLLEHGFVDKIVQRDELKDCLRSILEIHSLELK